MTNYNSKILSASISGLNATQAVIANTANNIANVNTDGYTRRVVNLKTRGSSNTSGQLDVGSGVDVAGITRVVDSYLEKLLKGSKSDESSYQVQSDIMSRVETLFSLNGSTQTVGSTMTAFFTAVNDLTVNPSSIELRANVIACAEDLVNTIKNTYDTIAGIQNECNRRIENEVQTINNLTSEIAKLNASIMAQEGGSNQVAADARDAREALLNQLSEKIGFTTLELSDGSVTVSLASGFPLVAGSQSRKLEFIAAPSFAGASMAKALDGSALGYVVYDYSSGAGTSHINLTEDLLNGGGEVGGLLTMRGYAPPNATSTSPFNVSGPLVEIASRVELISRSLLSDLNLSYLGPTYTDPLFPGYNFPTAGDLNGNVPDVYGFFDIDFNGTKDQNGNGLPDDLDTMLDVNGNPATSYSSILKLNFKDPSRLAAALSDSTAPLVFASGDGRNIENLAALQKQSRTFSLGTSGTLSLTGTFDDVYSETVIKVGSIAASAAQNLSSATRYAATVQTQRDSVSAVNLNEEFSNLIKYQRAYQASARLIKTADEILQQLVNLI